MNQPFRIAIKRKGREVMHYVIRDKTDLKNMFSLLEYWFGLYDDIEYIKWVPIPALEEV